MQTILTWILEELTFYTEIKMVKDSWNREEVINLLNKLNEQINIVNKVEFENEITLEQWIEENL